jgi:hypothetical protein
MTKTMNKTKQCSEQYTNILRQWRYMRYVTNVF